MNPHDRYCCCWCYYFRRDTLPQCLRIYSHVIPRHSGSWWASPSEPTLVSGSLERGSTGGHTFSVPCPSARVMTPTSKTSLLLHVFSFPHSSTYSCTFIRTTLPSLTLLTPWVSPLKKKKLMLTPSVIAIYKFLWTYRGSGRIYMPVAC